MSRHEWVRSTLGHGEAMCCRCFITNREAAVLGLLNDCDAPAQGIEAGTGETPLGGSTAQPQEPDPKDAP